MMFWRSIRQVGVLVAFGMQAAWPLHAQSLPAAGDVQDVVVLDRAVAVVNRHVILASDVDDEIRIARLDPALVGEASLSRARALDQLVSRSLIEQQIRHEDAQSVEPTSAEIERRINEIRHSLPACVRNNCETEQGWKSFLAASNLTPERMASYMRYRLQILAFIEQRFRSGIRIPAEDVQKYYRETLLPEFDSADAAPPLEKVSARIEEILLEQRVNELFDDWLTNLRKQGDVEVLDSSLAEAAAKEARP